MGVNTLQTFTPWWRYSASVIYMKLGDNNQDVLNQRAKIQNFSPIGSMGCHRLLVLSININPLTMKRYRYHYDYTARQLLWHTWLR